MLLKPQKPDSRIQQSPAKENNRMCPMCGNTYTTPSGVVNKYPFRQCHRCLFVYCPLITQEYLALLHEQGYQLIENAAPTNALSAEDTLAEALAFFEDEQPLRILDFGTGQSSVWQDLPQQGHKVTAVDITPAAIAHPDRVKGDLLEIGFEDNMFDLVYAYQVFEHLPQPKPYLDELFRLTRHDGIVLIHTDMETPERENEGFENWEYVSPPDHCTFFRHKTFEVYLEDKPHELLHKDPYRVIFRKKV